GNDLTLKFPQDLKALAKIKARSAVLDGELIAIDTTGNPSFSELQNCAISHRDCKLLYCAFDLLHAEGKDFTALPLCERKQKLQSIIQGTGVVFTPSLDGTQDEIIQSCRRQNLEGIVAKDKHSRYEPGQRNGRWIKMPFKNKQEFVIGGYCDGRGKVESILVGYYDHGSFKFAGQVRQGLNPINRVSLYEAINPLRIKKCPFINLPNEQKNRWGSGITAAEMDDYCWVKPATVAVIHFTEWTNGNLLRHPAFEALRDDKPATEVVRETPRGQSSVL
ncbi:MAG: polymerase LigD, ligase domain protein, partial [Pedosphaera sp.]|nr:polymerase LigD, ligase domain protein [Pedosphaera sp.]